MSEQGNGVSSEDRIWIIALAILCLGILGFGVFYSTNTISGTAFLAGQCLVSALLLWGVFYAVFLRKRDIKSKSIAFISIYTALFVGSLIAASQQKQQALQALSSVQKEMSRVTDASVDSSGVPAKIERRPATTPQARGEFGEMERFVKEIIDRGVAQRNDYLLELEATGWNSVLDAQRIKNDSTLSESKLVVKRAKAIVDKYERKAADVKQNTREHINFLNISESSKKEMLAGFDKSSMGKAGGREQWKLEKQMVLEVEKIFVFLAANKRWQIQGGQILFYSTEDLARFNGHMENIQQMTQQQQQIQKDIYAEMNRKVESVKNAVK